MKTMKTMKIIRVSRVIRVNRVIRVISHQSHQSSVIRVSRVIRVSMTIAAPLLLHLQIFDLISVNLAQMSLHKFSLKFPWYLNTNQNIFSCISNSTFTNFVRLSSIHQHHHPSSFFFQSSFFIHPPFFLQLLCFSACFMSAIEYQNEIIVAIFIYNW